MRATEDPALLVARVLLGLDRWIEMAEEESTSSTESQESSMIRKDVWLVVPGEPLDEESLRQTLVRFRNDAVFGMQGC